MHLAAAGLIAAEFDAMAQAFEHGDDGFSGLGEKRVVIAGDEGKWSLWKRSPNIIALGGVLSSERTGTAPPRARG